MSARFHDPATIAVLWRRDLLLFARQRSRLLGALLPPLLLWLAIGAGISPSFAAGRGGVGYMEYLFPGMIFMLVLQSSISATMSVIEDRRQGFLQGVLVGPGSRSALVLGQEPGLGDGRRRPRRGLPGAGPVRGLRVRRNIVARDPGGAGAHRADPDHAGLHDRVGARLGSGLSRGDEPGAVPALDLSGAMFPVEGLHPVMAAFVRWNPLTYAMSSLRRTIYGGATPEGFSPRAPRRWEIRRCCWERSACWSPWPAGRPRARPVSE